MSFDLIPRTFFNSGNRLPSLINDFFEEDNWSAMLPSSGLSISEDDTSVSIEMAMPGLEMSDIEVTLEKGILWVRGNRKEKEEDKKRKFYRKASSSFSYRVAVPGNVDENKEPSAVFKNGVMIVTFQKVAEMKPLKIEVKAE